jgi:hypothetical protein
VKQHDDFEPTEEMNDSGESFEELERYLTQAMRRVDAPEGFADRVMERAKAAAPAKAKVLIMPSRPRLWVGSAIAAVLLMGVFAGDQQYDRHLREKAEAEVAQKQFEAGMQITDRALEHTRDQLERAGVMVGR